MKDSIDLHHSSWWCNLSFLFLYLKTKSTSNSRMTARKSANINMSSSWCWKNKTGVSQTSTTLNWVHYFRWPISLKHHINYCMIENTRLVHFFSCKLFFTVLNDSVYFFVNKLVLTSPQMPFEQIGNIFSNILSHDQSEAWWNLEFLGAT